ncbi:MAG: PilN domain-containing protein [Pseudomonadota bacterium]|nr:PilN domain-containing protein [Pseudomonadota bacterium]
MQRINLSTRKKTLAVQASRLPAVILVAVVIVLLLVLGGDYLSLRHQYGQSSQKLRQLEARHAALQEQSRNYQNLVDQIRTMESRYKKTAEQLQMAAGIKAQRHDWYSIIAAISRQVPKRVWLTDISSSSENSATTAASEAAGTDSPVQKTIVTITGRALDSPAIVRYLENLQTETDILAAVDFSEVIRIEADENTGIPAHFSFVVSCRLK